MNTFHHSELLSLYAQDRQHELQTIAAQFRLARQAQSASFNLVQWMRNWWRQPTTPTRQAAPRMPSAAESMPMVAR